MYVLCMYQFATVFELHITYLININEAYIASAEVLISDDYSNEVHRN